MNKILPISAITILAIGLAACSNMQMGSADAKTEATGSAGGSQSQNANDKLERCDRSLGTIAVVEDTNAPWYGILTGQYRLGSTAPVLKLMIQQSNCFVVVERGRAMDNMMQERSLSQSGELRSRSNFGKGQMVAADYSLSPSITFSNTNAGGAGAAIGGLFGSVGAIIGGSLNAKEASTLLTLIDNRSGVQLAAAEGSAKNWDFGMVGGLLGSGLGGVGGGYANTAEGKVIVAAFMDSYNGVVRAVRNYKMQEVRGGLGTGGNLAVQGGSMPLVNAQERLNELGFNVGTPDGKLGPRTKSQLSRFQQSRKIPVTGILDDATIAELMK
ncbi:MAG: peptidoglycan-binding protein [Candidatus Accumulibacter sp.]|jgi:curli biogenesis system outer membrane secretion channel CsgG|nr:peptidoglycan-binding protein [Accumulibacter sp.]